MGRFEPTTLRLWVQHSAIWANLAGQYNVMMMFCNKALWLAKVSQIILSYKADCDRYEWFRNITSYIPAQIQLANTFKNITLSKYATILFYFKSRANPLKTAILLKVANLNFNLLKWLDSTLEIAILLQLVLLIIWSYYY